MDMMKLKKSLKKNRIYFILILLLFVFTRCWIFTFEDTSIAPEILPLFEEGDTIIYKCNLNVDSFYVEKAKLYKVNEDDGSGQEWDNERFISEIVQIDCLNSCYLFHASITPSEYRIRFYGFDKFSNSITNNDSKYYGLNRKIGDYQLKDLYRVFDFKADTISGREIVEVFYSKKYGFIEYRLTNGEVFQIDEDCLTMLMARE